MGKKEEENGNPYQNVDRSTALQEAKKFHETPLRPRLCSETCTKVIYLANQGEEFTTTEATDFFFAMTKLFQNNDITLRRMCYLTIKELSKMTEHAFIMTQSLTKDMNGSQDLFRPGAVRALCSITDPTTLQSIERYMKQAIVDKNTAVASAALISSFHLCDKAYDVVKRWANEAQQASSSDNQMVQYHALGLLHHLRKRDPLAIEKLVVKLSRSGLKSPLAYTLLIRIAAKLLADDDDRTALFDFIESCLRNKNEMVVYEAASAIVNMKNISHKEIAPAVSVLQQFCGSPKPALRYAGVRSLNKVAMKHPSAVTACNLDLENLITDSNRSIATLAITTLLKTGSESSVERLMKQISNFMSEISDEFKIVVVEAVSALCAKYPRKHSVMMEYLSKMLRDDGGFEYKKAIVNCLISIISESPESKELGLMQLCEFIEDCEHTSLATRVITLLGDQGPQCANPSKFIRFIYNRVILENEVVRAAAISALAKFGAVPALTDSVLTLLLRSMVDEDDEVRDRATFYYHVLKLKDDKLNSQMIINGLVVCLPALERQLKSYLEVCPEEPFNMKTVPVMATQEDVDKIIAASATKKKEPSKDEIYAEELSRIPDFAALGPLFKSSNEQKLTEAETEYQVSVVKHTFLKHMVLQFNCANTLNDQVLKDLSIEVEGADGYEPVSYIPTAELVYGTPGKTYCVLDLPEDDEVCASSLSCQMKFIVHDCDPNSGDVDETGYPDEYVIDDIEISVGDHIQRVLKPNFPASWEEVGDEHELEETYHLSEIGTLEEAVKQIITFLGMQPCERSDKVPEGKVHHVLILSGVYRGGHEILVRSKLVLKDGVQMQLTVRGTDPTSVAVVASAIA